MFPSSSFTKPSRSAVLGGAGGTAVGSGGSCLIGSSLSSNSAVADEYEELIKRLSLEIEATSQNICELQVRRQQLLEQLDEVKKAHHQIMEQRSHWQLALSFGSEGNEIGQLCRPWGVAIVRMPQSLLSQYSNDENNYTSSNGFYSSLPGCPSSTSTTGLISSSSSPSANHTHHQQKNHRTTDSIVVGSGRNCTNGGVNSLTKTNAILTGNSSSSATNNFRDNINSASGSSSSSSSFELEFSLFSQYLNVDELALLPSHHRPSTSSVYTGNSSSSAYSSALTSSNDDIGEPNTGTSSSTGHAATASITGISSSHHAHSLQHLSNYGSDNININNTNSLLSSYGSENHGRIKTSQYLPYLSTLSSSSNHCDSSSNSTDNSITANLKNSITGNLSSYASSLQENFKSANGSSSPSSLWDINPLSTNNITKSSANSPSALVNGNRNGYKCTKNSVNNATGDVNHKHYLIAIADRSNNRIQLLHFDATAITIKVIHVFGSGPGTRAGLFDRPAGIAINTSLNHIVVADKDNHRIQVFDLKGRYLFKFGEKGNRVGQFCYPWDIDSCPSTHQLLVSDTRNRRVQMFSPYGQYVAHFSHPLDSPRGVSFLGDSKIVVSDFNKHRLLIFDKFHIKEDASKVIGFGEGTGWGQFLRPQGISIAGNNIFCADSRNNRICIYNLLTQSFEYLSQDLNCDRPSGLHVVDNILVVVDFGNNRLQICLRH